MKHLLIFLLIIAGCTTVPKPVDQPVPSPSPSVAASPSPAPRSPEVLVAVTLDDPWVKGTVAALEAMRVEQMGFGNAFATSPATLTPLVFNVKKPGVRVVFDEKMPAKEYVEVLNEIRPHVGFLMGELLDSYYLKGCSPDCYKKRAQDYLAKVGPLLDALEVGNEANGVGWLGTQVVEKVTIATGLAKDAGVKAALTLYMDKKETWKEWARALPAELRAKFDYVLMSHYAADNAGHEPDWQATADLMGELFPNALIGLGEMGPSEEHEYGVMSQDQRLAMATRYWRLPVQHPRWIGGGFYWYGSEEIKKNASKLISAVRAVM